MRLGQVFYSMIFWLKKFGRFMGLSFENGVTHVCISIKNFHPFSLLFFNNDFVSTLIYLLDKVSTVRMKVFEYLLLKIFGNRSTFIIKFQSYQWFQLN